MDWGKNCQKLDSLLNQLPRDGTLIFVDDHPDFQNKEDLLYHLNAENYIEIDEAGSKIITCSLTNKGLLFRNGGGYEALKMEQEKGDEMKRLQEENLILSNKTMENEGTIRKLKKTKLLLEILSAILAFALALLTLLK